MPSNTTLQIIDGRVILTLRVQDTAAAAAASAAAIAVAARDQVIPLVEDAIIAAGIVTENAGIAAAAADSIKIGEISLGSISGTVNINLSLGTIIIATLTASTTFTFSGLPAAGFQTAFTFQLSGIHPITFTGARYPYGVIPKPAGALYEIPCQITSAGVLTVYASLNDIIVP